MARSAYSGLSSIGTQSDMPVDEDAFEMYSLLRGLVERMTLPKLDESWNEYDRERGRPEDEDAALESFFRDKRGRIPISETPREDEDWFADPDVRNAFQYFLSH